MNTILKDYLTYSRAQRNGIFVLMLLIVAIQFAMFFVKFPTDTHDPPEKLKWLAVQKEVDSLKLEQHNFKPKIYPFNPNFITDYKGYRLGMSTSQIDRLLAFRKKNKYVNSAAEFQRVTQISDSLLSSMSPYFKFPDWVSDKKNRFDRPNNKFETKSKVIVKTDLNKASQDELIAIYGIGAALSDRILKQRELLGAFVSMSQLEEIWGLSSEVIVKLNERFLIRDYTPKKIRINEASIKELSQFPYFKYKLAKQIVTFRTMNGPIKNSEDLDKINDWPTEKTQIIALYLDF